MVGTPVTHRDQNRRIFRIGIEYAFSNDAWDVDTTPPTVRRFVLTFQVKSDFEFERLDSAYKSFANKPTAELRQPTLPITFEAFDYLGFKTDPSDRIHWRWNPPWRGMTQAGSVKPARALNVQET